MSTTVETATGIRPFHAEIAEEQVDDLRRRVAASRWPTKELVADRSHAAGGAARVGALLAGELRLRTGRSAAQRLATVRHSAEGYVFTFG